MRKQYRLFRYPEDAHKFYETLKANPVAYSVDKPVVSGSEWLVSFTRWSLD